MSDTVKITAKQLEALRSVAEGNAYVAEVAEDLNISEGAAMGRLKALARNAPDLIDMSEDIGNYYNPGLRRLYFQIETEGEEYLAELDAENTTPEVAARAENTTPEVEARAENTTPRSCVRVGCDRPSVLPRGSAGIYCCPDCAPTAPQLAAVKTYAELAGEGWKRALTRAWLRGGSPLVDSDTYSLLHALRNSHGFGWLAGFSLS